MPTGIPVGAMCVQRFDDSRKFCNSHYFSHFAAFFIDARTKRSVVESCNYYYFLTLIATTKRFDIVQPAGKPAEETYGTQKTRVQQGPKSAVLIMILPQVHLRKPCYDFYFL